MRGSRQRRPRRALLEAPPSHFPAIWIHTRATTVQQTYADLGLCFEGSLAVRSLTKEVWEKRTNYGVVHIGVCGLTTITYTAARSLGVQSWNKKCSTQKHFLMCAGLNRGWLQIVTLIFFIIICLLTIYCSWYIFSLRFSSENPKQKKVRVVEVKLCEISWALPGIRTFFFFSFFFHSRLYPFVS